MRPNEHGRLVILILKIASDVVVVLPTPPAAGGPQIAILLKSPINMNNVKRMSPNLSCPSLLQTGIPPTSPYLTRCRVPAAYRPSRLWQQIAGFPNRLTWRDLP